MSFKIISFSAVRISVGNVLISSAWYQKFFECAPIAESNHFVSFNIAGVCFDLARADQKSPESKGGSVGYWLVDDLEATVQRATELGAKVYRGPLKVPELGRTIVQLEDPFGNIIGLEGSYQGL